MRHLRTVMPGWARALLIALLLGACAPIISEYSLDAYKNATSLKAETFALVDKSGGKFRDHQKEVEALTTKIDAAYEFAAGLPNNELSAAQWRLMRNPERGLYGGFIRIWKQGPLPAEFREDKKKQLGAAFDEIICLEINKKETQRCTGNAALAPKT
jgi:hypothetical protein